MPGADGRVGVAVDEDEGAGARGFPHKDRTQSARGGRQIAEADLVQARAFGRQLLEGIDVDPDI